MSSGDRREPGERVSVRSYLDETGRFARRPAYVWKDGVRRRSRSWGEVRSRAAAAAAALRAAGIRAGGRVLLQGPDGPDWVEALFGCFLLGAHAVPLDEETDAGFRERVAAECAARVLVAPAGTDPPPGARSVALGSWSAADAAAVPPAVPLGAGDTAEIVFTSGTTGRPKGVVLTHGNLLAGVRGIERGYRRRERWLELLAPLPFVSTLPLSHMFGQALAVFLPAMMGLTVVFAPPRPREAREALRRSRAWGLFCVPRVLDLLARDLERDLRRRGGAEAFERRHRRWSGRPRWLQALAHWKVQRRFGWRFRLFVVGGAAVPAGLRRFWDEMGYLVVVGYGLTETAPIVSISNPFERGSESVGRPGREQEVRLGPGGEVLVRGPNVTPGYLGGEREGFEDGWFRTGDVGEMDQAGRLRIRGRLKDVIVTAEGENVHARDVEEVLAAEPGVRAAAVVGLAAEDGGAERVHAVLLLEEGAGAERAVEAANRRLQPRQRIRGFTVWPESDFPRTATGKVRKAAVLDGVRALARGGRAGEEGGPSGSELRRLLARIAGRPPESLEEDASLGEGLGFGSLDLVEVAAQIEEDFGVALPEERLGAMSVAVLERIVERETSVAAPGAAPETGEDRGEAPEAGRAGAIRPSRRAEEGRGGLRMPMWADRLPVRLLRRALQETLMFPFVRFYARPRVEGLARLAGVEGPFLLVADHHSHLDTVLLQASLPRRLRGDLAPAVTTRHHAVFFGERTGPAYRYAREWIQMRTLQLLFHAWPLPETAGFRRSLDFAGVLADRGRCILIFPEGRLVPEGVEERFREGIGIFARDLRLPVVPARLDGTARVLPPRARWPRFGRTRVVFGPPLRFRPEDSPAGITARVEEAVRSL